MTQTAETLPSFLKAYCSTQDMSRYTARDHAAWRCIMRRSLPFFRKHAVTGYEEGLKKTALPIDRIPNIRDMDEALQKIGWGAVPVRGFIPPWAFLEFQARCILPIATDMRNVNHITYTPAPDIVHEAAGHAPILPDKDYSAYLARYAQLCTKAIFSRQDARLYEAVRVLSDIKEKPESTPAEIAEAEATLEQRMSEMTFVSEAARVGRMSWWTAEYGLAGKLDDPKIFGAGLLSSVGESKNCLGTSVKKIPLSIECTEVAFNITKPQPQLFVARSMQHLVDVLDELDSSLSYKIGGKYALEKGRKADETTTAVLDSGIATSGVLTDYLTDKENIIFLKWSGTVQLSFDRAQLPGQGVDRHPQGFSSPIGRWEQVADKDPSILSDSELKKLGMEIGKQTSLKFTSGFTVSGRITHIERKGNKVIYITWENCTVRRGDQLYFDPSWGPFDMLVGTTVSSVYGGPADRNFWPMYTDEEVKTNPARQSPYSADEITLFKIYEQLRSIREKSTHSAADEKALQSHAETLLKKYPNEWLSLVEAYEIAIQVLHLSKEKHPWLQSLATRLNANAIVEDNDVRDLLRQTLSQIES
ncbi:MAG: aromatic amino acid hydroxylase [Oligoflexales bacterium]